MEPKILINDLFTSVQGEGAQVGRPVIFVRVSKCNMSCSFCDTNYEPVKHEVNTRELADLIVQEYLSQQMDHPAVLLTGGEPTLYNLLPLIQWLKAQEYWIGIESNGLNKIDTWAPYIDHITVSPKAPKGLGMNYADEMRLVVQDFVTPEYIQQIDNSFRAKDYFLSAMEVDGKFNFDRVYGLLDWARRNCKNEWRLNIQSHKIAGIK